LRKWRKSDTLILATQIKVSFLGLAPHHQMVQPFGSVMKMLIGLQSNQAKTATKMLPHELFYVKLGSFQT